MLIACGQKPQINTYMTYPAQLGRHAHVHSYFMQAWNTPASLNIHSLTMPSIQKYYVLVHMLLWNNCNVNRTKFMLNVKILHCSSYRYMDESS